MQISLRWLPMLAIFSAHVQSSESSSGTITSLREHQLENDRNSLNGHTFNSSSFSVILRHVDRLGVHLRDDSDADSNPIVWYLLRESNCPLEIYTGADEWSARPPPRDNAVTLRYRQLRNVLNEFARRSGILICVLLDRPNAEDLLSAARHLWLSRAVYKVFYLSTTANVFFNPFIPVGNGRFGAFENVDTFSETRIFRNLLGYPVRVYIFDSVYSSAYGDSSTKRITTVRGADAKAAQLLSEKLNFTMDLQWPDDEFFGARLENGSYDGAIGRIIRQETDIVLTGFFVKDYLTRDIDFSVSVYMDDLCCYVKKANRVPQSVAPLYVVNIDIWFSFILMGMISSVLWFIIRYMNIRCGIRSLEPTKRILWTPKCHVTFVRILIDTWVVWVRVNIVRFPPFNSERIFVGSLCLVSVIFGALFESGLATVYIRPLYYKDLNTLEDLEEAKFRIYIKHAAMKDDLFYGQNSTVFRNLDKKVMLVGELEERLISMMSKRGGFAAVTRSSSLVLNDIRYFITNKIHKIPECPKNYHIAFIMPKQSPYEKVFNVQLLRFIEAGFIDHWIDEMKHKAKITIHQFPDYVAELGTAWKILLLEDLQLPFYVLGVGGSMAFLALLGEIIMH